MHLLDTNVFLEILLEQQNAASCARLLRESQPGSLHITDFSLYSVGIALVRRKKRDAFAEFIRDVQEGMTLIRLDFPLLANLADRAEQLGLDFDDAYQYAAAEARDLTIVSLDDDFDKTARGRVHPDEALKNLLQGR